MTVELHVTRELMPHLDTFAPLLPGIIVGQRDGDHDTVILDLDVPDAPHDAAQMSPIFARAGDSVSLDHISWHRADGTRIDLGQER